MRFKYLTFLFIFISLILSLVISACTKDYTLAPFAATTPTPTATPHCSGPSALTGTLPSGIVMYGDVQYGMAYGSPAYEVDVYLVVNGVPQNTAAITITGPSTNLAIPYVSQTTISGHTYSKYTVYSNTSVGSFVPFNTYTLTAITTAGTATASAALPPTPSVLSNGTGGSWNGPSMYTYGLVNAVVSVSQTFYQNSCASAGSISIPSSAYPSSQNYVIDFSSSNYTTTITGGQGYLICSGVVIIEI